MATSGSFNVIETFRGSNEIVGKFTWSRAVESATVSKISWNFEGYVKSRSGTGFSDKYSIDSLEVNGSSIFSGNGTNTSTITKSGSFSLTHTQGVSATFTVVVTQYWLVSSMYGGNSGLRQPETFTITVDAPPQPAKVTAAEDFDDEGAPYMNYSNPSGSLVNKLEVGIYMTDGRTALANYRTVATGMTFYSFGLTDAERKLFRQKCTGASMPVRYYIRTTIGSSTYTNFITKTMTLINYMPTLSPSVTDSYAPTRELTGDATKFVKYFSNASFNTGATAQKEATIDSQYIICGNTVLEDYTSTTGVIRGIESNTLYFSVTDSRGFTTRDALVVDLIPYIKLTSALTLQPLTLAGDLSFTVEGSYFNDTFGAQHNSLQFEYGLRENGGSINWTIINPTVTYGDNRYEATYSISGLNPDSFYDITVNVIDALMSVQTTTESVTSKPVFDWGKTDFKHNTAVYLTKNLSLRTIDNDGNDVSVLNPCNPNGALVLGWGQYDKANGDTSVYGNNINLVANEKIRINGTEIGGNVLWEGAYYMNGSQAISLSSPISEQINGIVLVFSLYRNNVAEDVSIHSFFVSKKEVELLPNAPHNFFMMINSGFSTIGAKYLYIADEVITGHATNSLSGANNGITYNNGMFVLRYVIGV